MHKILIVDDHPTVRFAVRLLLEREGYEVVSEAHDGVSAVSMSQEHNPEVVILDLGLPRLDGLSVLERLRALDPAPRIMVFTGLPPRLFAKRCIEAGASAFVRKDEDLQILVGALRAVLSGYSYLPDALRMAPRMHSESDRLDRLSNREFEVMRQLAKGATNHEIAEAMILSSKTISTYKTRIMDKLQVRSLAELLDMANRHEMI
ncbi:response regulator transcription factor [Pseudomonas sp. 148P]|uniref:Response regulator transcription factor n=1 Tax=Pseudomonas ulcerans TaxID=3115852 RepID=A0ABU7HR75_9PSED|nr:MULTISPECIES: response regulator transcription factor [unclassified Pseudomonas]MEE1923060.1 response regulator transcription factor [Pseudomonas sp. 147P]MEE1934022.1 response regulator transcription factor [Pseudomonas sp. 148P]